MLIYPTMVDYNNLKVLKFEEGVAVKKLYYYDPVLNDLIDWWEASHLNLNTFKTKALILQALQGPMCWCYVIRKGQVAHSLPLKKNIFENFEFLKKKKLYLHMFNWDCLGWMYAGMDIYSNKLNRLTVCIWPGWLRWHRLHTSRPFSEVLVTQFKKEVNKTLRPIPNEKKTHFFQWQLLN